MFKCGDKCTGRLAAEAKLVREKVCYENAKKENGCRVMKIATRKIKDTTDYIKIMEEWPTAVDLAIAPALTVARIHNKKKRDAIMKQIEAVFETDINPIDGGPLTKGVTLVIIQYLIAKHDGTPFVREKRFALTQDTFKLLQYIKTVCKQHPKAEKFVTSLMAV